jgi:hypothetical protein
VIKLNIIDGPDKNVLGERIIDLNFFILGNNEGNIRIKDALIENSMWLFSTFLDPQSKQIRNTISSLPQDKYFFLNDKKYQAEKSFKPNDLIKIGNTTIRIIETNFIEAQDFDQKVMDQLEDLFISGHPVTELLSQISDLMKRQTKR